MSTLCEASPAASTTSVAARKATYVVFSGDLDRQLMAFTLATAAAASGMQVTMFFTFWGVSVLRTPRRAKGKSLVERMFGWMIPSGPRALALSKLQFAGVGRWMMRRRMKQVGIASLDQLIETAEALGVRLLICDASMKLLGLRAEELRPSVQVAGAAGCVASTCDADVAMVI